MGFSNRSQDSSREVEADLKRRLNSRLSARRRCKGIDRVRHLIRLADADAGSVMEATFLWMLHCWIRPRIPWETQYEQVLDGDRYFADAAVPSRKLSLEFDGEGKLGADAATQSQRKQDFYRRAGAFLRHGWTTVSVTSSQMRNLFGAMWSLGRDLEPFGITRKRPDGPLWEEISW